MKVLLMALGLGLASHNVVAFEKKVDLFYHAGYMGLLERGLLVEEAKAQAIKEAGAILRVKETFSSEDNLYSSKIEAVSGAIATVTVIDPPGETYTMEDGRVFRTNSDFSIKHIKPVTFSRLIPSRFHPIKYEVTGGVSGVKETILISIDPQTLEEILKTLKGNSDLQTKLYLYEKQVALLKKHLKGEKKKGERIDFRKIRTLTAQIATVKTSFVDLFYPDEALNKILVLQKKRDAKRLKEYNEWVKAVGELPLPIVTKGGFGLDAEGNAFLDLIVAYPDVKSFFDTWPESVKRNLSRQNFTNSGHPRSSFLRSQVRFALKLTVGGRELLFPYVNRRAIGGRGRIANGAKRASVYHSSDRERPLWKAVRHRDNKSIIRLMLTDEELSLMEGVKVEIVSYDPRNEEEYLKHDPIKYQAFAGIVTEDTHWSIRSAMRNRGFRPR